MDNYLFIGELIKARIQESVPGLAQVEHLGALADIENQSAASPAVWVIYLGDEGNDDKLPKNIVEQFWAAVLATAYPEQEATGKRLGQIINALSDWQPNSAGVQPITRARERMPAQYENSFLCFPLIFSARFIWPRQPAWQPNP